MARILLLIFAGGQTEASFGFITSQTMPPEAEYRREPSPPTVGYGVNAYPKLTEDDCQGSGKFNNFDLIAERGKGECSFIVVFALKFESDSEAPRERKLILMIAWSFESWQR